jgi:SAM-dependent methyltransferase
MQLDTDKVADHWGRSAPEEGRDFYTFAPLAERHAECVTGELKPHNRMWLEDWLCERITRQIGRPRHILSLCCGFGYLERYLAERDFCDTVEGLDLSPGAIEAAKQSAAGLRGVSYRVADLNALRLPRGSCDVVWANGALHHISNLEFAVNQIHKALRPGGMLVACEYVGPKHMNCGPRQRQAINAVMMLLPEHLRGPFKEAPPRRRWPFSSPPAETLPDQWSYDASYFRDQDPSEAVRSNEIIPVLRQEFREIEVQPFNGSALQYALSPVFYENFRRARDGALLDGLVAIERALITSGELTSDNAVIIAVRRSS